MVVLGEHREAVQHQHPQSVSSQKKRISENGVSVVAMCAESSPKPMSAVEPATIPAQTDTPASSTFQPMVKCSRRLPCPSSLAVWLSATVKTRSLRHR